MSTSLVAGAVALLIVSGLVVTLGAMSLLSGALHFLFAKPSLDILRPSERERRFAFGFKWDSSREPARFDRIKLRLFNPFGSPTQVEVTREFAAQSSSFAQEVDFGVGMDTFWQAEGFDNALVQIEVMAVKDGVTYHFEMKGHKFKEKFHAASLSVEAWESKYKKASSKPVYNAAVERTFISDPLPETSKLLKLASNPVFAGNFAPAPAAGGDAAPAENNFTVAKVWIEPGCIVCDACEGIYPEVFEVLPDTCIIRADAPLNNGLLIQEAAEACPVEVIKFST